MPTTKTSTTSILSKLKIKSLNEMQLASIEAIDKNNNVLMLSLMAYNVRGLPQVWIVAVSARQLKSIENMMLKLTTKSQIEFGQARY